VRPKKFFEGLNTLNLVPGYENYLYNSFPSGHTTSAFTTFFCLALIIENKYIKFIMFGMALTIGFSRVYLSQHFLNDVYAGSLIGVITSIVTYWVIFLWERSANADWMEKSLLNRS
jgi:membrane-associated phospholipid phosphatase